MRICFLSVIIGLMFHARLSQAFDVMPTTAPATSTSTTKSDRVLPMAVIVNGSDGGVWLLVEHDGILYATSDAFEEWRLALDADTAPVDFKGQQFFPLNAIPGYRGKIDFANQSVELQFSPQAFAGTRLVNEKIKRPEVSPVLPSLQISYDLNYSQSHQSASTSTQDLSALTEVAYSSNAGVLTSSAIGRNLTSDKLSGTPSQWLRLETTLTKNFPDGDQTLRVGDANTRVGLLGRNVYFGGVQFGTNFGLTPGYVHQPIPVLSGFSSAPSTVQLYVNDVLRQVSNVPTGPFAIENFPALTASGDAKIVVTDQLGRQTVYQQSFFTNSQLLTSGLNDWSVEVGKIRNNLGSTDSNYGDTFASGYLRHGLNDRVT